MKKNKLIAIENNGLFRDILYNINTMFFLHDPDGHFILTNRCFEENIGYSKSEYQIKNVADLLFGSFTLEFNEYLRRLNANGHDDGILSVITKDGRSISIGYSSSVFDCAEGQRYVSVMCQDITEQLITQKALLESEKKLKESELKYRDIFENINEYIYLHDMEGHFIDTNAHFRNNMGYSKTEFHNMVLKDMMPDKYKPGFDEYLERIKVNGYEKGLLRLVSKNGRELLVEYNNSLVQGLEGPIFVRGVSRDITDEYKARKALERSEEQLRIARDELEKRVQMRTKELKQANKRLEEKTTSLEEANIALRVLLSQKDEAQKKAEEEILNNIKDMVFPLLSNMKLNQSLSSHNTYLDLIESNLNKAILPFAVKINSKYYRLTPVELQVANLIREGKRSKEIAALFNVSTGTIHTHRENIRKKLGITNKRLNLRIYLLNLV